MKRSVLARTRPIPNAADNPGAGAGAYGDSTELLRALLEAGVKNACFVPMVDPEVAHELRSAVVGARVRITLGGKIDRRYRGGPHSLEAELVSIGDGRFVGDGPMIHGLTGSFGPSAVVRVGAIEILVVTIARQILDLQQFQTFGIDPQSKSVVALKSMQHFRAAFEPIAGKVIVCDSGALCTPRYDRVPYRNAPGPIFPLDRREDWYPFGEQPSGREKRGQARCCPDLPAPTRGWSKNQPDRRREEGFGSPRHRREEEGGRSGEAGLRSPTAPSVLPPKPEFFI